MVYIENLNLLEENDQNKVKEVVETTTQDVNNIAQTNAVPLGNFLFTEF